MASHYISAVGLSEMKLPVDDGNCKGLFVHGFESITVTLGQFHPHFTSSFYASRSQKRIKTLMTRLSICTLGKALHIHFGKIDTSSHNASGVGLQNPLLLVWQGLRLNEVKLLFLSYLRPILNQVMF